MHTYQGRGLYIYYLYTPYWTDSQYLIRIRVYSRRKDCQHSRIYKYKLQRYFALYRLHWHRMEKANMAALYLVLKIKCITPERIKHS